MLQVHFFQISKVTVGVNLTFVMKAEAKLAAEVFEASGGVVFFSPDTELLSSPVKKVCQHNKY